MMDRVSSRPDPMRPLRIAAIVALVAGGIGAAVHYAILRHREGLRRTLHSRTFAECRRPQERTASPDDILRELAGHLRWISQFRGSEQPAAPGDWCRWKIEVELGLRPALPRAEPPPAVDLPSVGVLVGVPRDRILSELGDPGCGRWDEKTGKRPEWVRFPCAEASRIEYSIYYLPRRSLGGGPELILSFDKSGNCAAATWLHSQ